MESDINLTYPSVTAPMSFPDKDKYGNGCEWNKILISKQTRVFCCCYFSSREKAVVLYCAAFAAAQASLLVPIGLGAPILEAGSLGYGKGLIAGVPSVATVSSQKTAINHVAPAAGVAVAAAPVVLANNGIHGSGLIVNNGILANGLVA
ncbi:uncharacterized protein TNCT_569391, partial [Trichonephila clavata]